MLRIVTTAASRNAIRAVAPVARVAALRLAPACCLHTAAPRSVAPRAQEADIEEEGQREPIPFDEARSNLVSAFAKEAESFDLSEDFAESYAKDRNLSVSIDLPSESVVATRSAEGHKIQIAFRAEALDTQENMEEEEQQQADEEDKLPEHRFAVDITAPNGKILRLECFNSPKGELEVGNITFPDSVTPNPATTPRLTEEQEAEAARTALRTEELTEEASQALFDYLEALGVDDDLAVFVSSQAQHVRTQAMIQRINQLKAFAQ